MPCIYTVIFRITAILIALNVFTSTVAAEKQKKLSSHIIKSASEFDYPPFALVKSDGTADGFSVELLKAVAKTMGLQIDIAVGPWHEIKQMLADGELDVLPLVSYSSDRETVFDFTVPYLRMHGTIFVRKGETSIQSEADLKDKEIITMTGDTAHEYAIRHELTDHLILTDSFGNAFKMLSSGKHDAVIVQQLVGLQLIKKLNISNVVDLSPYRENEMKPSAKPLTGFEQKFCIAVKDGNRELLALLNEGLAIVVANGTYDELYQKWFSPILPPPKVPVGLMLKYLSFFLIPTLLLVSILALYYSRREVAKKTQSIRKEIAERIRTTQQLQEREAHLHSIFRAAPTGIGVVIDRRLKDVNSRLCEMTGYDKEELSGQSARMLYPTDEEFNFVGKEKYDQIRQYGTGAVETRWLHKDGRILDVWLSSTPFDSSDWSKGVTFTALDITDRKKSEEILRLTQFSVDHASDAIFWTGADARFIYVNETACNVLGYSRHELLAMSVHDIDPGISSGQWPAHWSELKKQGSLLFETNYCCKNGDAITVEVSENYLAYEGREYNHAFARNITERRVAEEERLSLERQILHAQKLKSLGVLAGGIAHDFNNILMTILGNADLALQDMSPVSPIRQNVKEIEIAARRAAGLSKQMLAYSGKGQFVIEPIDINELVEEMGHMLEVTISKKAVLKYHFADNLPMFEGDATQVRQIIMNLITNASEAIGEKSGVVAISTGAMDCDSDYLNTANFATRIGIDDPLMEGVYIYFEVADTGCGIDGDIMEKLFDPFFTTKFTGRGLGMAAVLGIVRGHKGAIKIYSEIDKGTTIKILFPATTDDLGLKVRTGREQLNALNWRAEGLVLIADDEESVCAVGKLMLERVGFTVLTAADGREAVDVFCSHADRIVCVVLDLTMPHLNGEQVFSEMRRIKPGVKVILSSGYNEHDATQRFSGKGLAGFLQKPYQSVALVAKLQEIIDNE